MIHPRIDELLDHLDSRYALVIVAAKRARQINNYHHQLGEGTFDDFPPPLVESRSKNYLTMALEEILRDPPEYVSTAKVFDMLMAVPKFGRVKAGRFLNTCRISQSKTVGGLSERQRTELIGLFDRP